jgi:hypothetical protein
MSNPRKILILGALLSMSACTPHSTPVPPIAPTIPLPPKAASVAVAPVRERTVIVGDQNNRLRAEVAKAQDENTKLSEDLKELETQEFVTGLELARARAMSEALEQTLRDMGIVLAEQEASINTLSAEVAFAEVGAARLEEERNLLRSNATELNTRITTLVEDTLPAIAGERDAAQMGAVALKTRVSILWKWVFILAAIAVLELALICGYAYFRVKPF